MFKKRKHSEDAEKVEEHSMSIVSMIDENHRPWLYACADEDINEKAGLREALEWLVRNEIDMYLSEFWKNMDLINREIPPLHDKFKQPEEQFKGGCRREVPSKIRVSTVYAFNRYY